jgi:hypothetical protein
MAGVRQALPRVHETDLLVIPFPDDRFTQDTPGLLPRLPCPVHRRLTVPVRVTGNKIVRFLIMMGVNVRFVSVRRVGVSAWQKG